MILTQKIQIRKLSKQDYLFLKQMCKDSKNFYNSVLYITRQHFFNNGEFLGMYARHNLVKQLPETQRMKSDVAAHIQLRIDWAFRSFFALKKKQKSGDYHCKVKMPHYLPKDGYYHIYLSPKSFNFTDTYFYFHPSKQVCRENNLKTNYKIKISFKKQFKGKIKQVAIIQHNNAQYFELAITYEHDESKTNLNLDKSNLLSIDCGLDNFATCLDCQSGRSFILDGRELKSINRWWNKQTAKLKTVYIKHKNSLKKKGVELEKSSKRLIRLTQQRKNQINNYLNQMVSYIIKYCAQKDIGTIIIGDWSSEIKQSIKLGKINNQNFVQIPFANFKQKLKHKCQIYGLELIFQDESYTSKCSFLDEEYPEKHTTYLGKRIHRGLFGTSKGTLINADVNGAANIAIKSKQGSNGKFAIARLSSGFTSNPKRIRLPDFERSGVKMSELVAYVANKQKQTSLEVA